MSEKSTPALEGWASEVEELRRRRDEAMALGGASESLCR